ncbi:MAG: serine/threonine-protein kinase [Pseudomonadota bacterium]
MRFCPECSTRHPDAQECCPACGRALVALSEDDLIGRELDGRYRVLELLGRGGMGQVYRARQRHVERDVAVKVIRRDLGQGEDLVKRFFREARMVAALKNPHVVTLHDFGVTPEGLIYFTMELLEGIPLSRLLKQQGRLPWRRAVVLARQVCEALEEAHGKDVIHRDLKPENIYVQVTDGRDLARVLDFGLAKSLEHGSHLTSRGVVVGTPEYMSPEQSVGVDVGHHSDLYSLGVLLYTMLTGGAPFTGGTPLQILHCHLHEAPQPPRIRCPEADIPGVLDVLVLELLQKDPALRPPDARDLARRLDRILEEGPPAAGPGEALDMGSVGAPILPEDDLLELLETESGAAGVAAAGSSAAFEDSVPLRPQRFTPAARRWAVVLLSCALAAAALLLWAPWDGAPPPRGTEEAPPPSAPSPAAALVDVVSRDLPEPVDVREGMATPAAHDLWADLASEDVPTIVPPAEVVPAPVPDAVAAAAPDVAPTDAASPEGDVEPPAARPDRKRHPVRIPAAVEAPAKEPAGPKPPPSGEEMFKLQEVRKEGGLFELKEVDPGARAD